MNIALTVFQCACWAINKLRAYENKNLLGSGSAVALYHLVEAEIEHAPVMLGVTALLASTNDRYKIRQCGYRCFPGPVVTHTMQGLHFDKCPADSKLLTVMVMSLPLHKRLICACMPKVKANAH